MTIKNKNATPKISVIITCYNYGKFIDEVIQSVHNQTFKDYEIIIIDDCSTDEFTKDKLKEYAEKPVGEDRISEIILLKQNEGVAAARNLAIKQAKAEYILCLDADDKIESSCLQKMYDVINTKKYDIVGCGYQEFGRSNKKNIRQYSKYGICRECLFPVTALFKKSDWKKIGGFAKDVEDEDWRFWLKLVEVGVRVHIIQEVLFLYRIHTISRNYAKLSKSLDFLEKLEVSRVEHNPKLFNWFIKENQRRIKKLRKKNSKLKILFSLAIVFGIIGNVIQILL